MESIFNNFHHLKIFFDRFFALFIHFYQIFPVQYLQLQTNWPKMEPSSHLFPPPLLISVSKLQILNIIVFSRAEIDVSIKKIVCQAPPPSAYVSPPLSSSRADYDVFKLWKKKVPPLPLEVRLTPRGVWSHKNWVPRRPPLYLGRAAYYQKKCEAVKIFCTECFTF